VEGIRMRAYIGIDNGVSGSLAFLSGDGEMVRFKSTPVRKEQSYTKAKAQITRVDWLELQTWFAFCADMFGNAKYTRAFIERPFVNPKGFKATVSALRALEATLICVEWAHLSYQYVDSREWQRVLLPKGCKGPELKAASKDIGIRLFPGFAEEIRKHKDADSLLIAEWARRSGL